LENLVKGINLNKYFHNKKQRTKIKACDGITLAIPEGKTLGLVGESGCGKTTVGRILLRLLDPDSGTVIYRNKELTRMSEGDIRPLRKHFQMIYQDSGSAFHPRMRVQDALKESLRLYRKIKGKELKEEINYLISRVNLHRGLLDHFIGNLSGGELKRLDIARVLSFHPEFIIADEPLSLLDVSIQSQIANLLLQIQHLENTTIMFISHDLRMVRMMSHIVAVMYSGKIVELAPKTIIADKPLHPYTQYLWNPRGADFFVRFLPSGCVYKNSCILYQKKGFPLICSEIHPPLVVVEKGHFVACHYALR